MGNKAKLYHPKIHKSALKKQFQKELALNRKHYLESLLDEVKTVMKVAAKVSVSEAAYGIPRLVEAILIASYKWEVFEKNNNDLDESENTVVAKLKNHAWLLSVLVQNYIDLFDEASYFQRCLSLAKEHNSELEKQ